MTTPLATGPFLAASVLLAGAGLAKLWRPADTARALRQAGLPAGRGLVRAGSAAEVAVAAVAWAGPGLGPPGWVGGAVVATAYVTLAAFVAVALARGWPLSSCGCFARPDTPPAPTHVVLNLGAAAAATGWAAADPPSWHAALAGQPWGGAALFLAGAGLAALAYLLFTRPPTPRAGAGGWSRPYDGAG